jgi:hypothetical protein
MGRRGFFQGTAGVNSFSWTPAELGADVKLFINTRTATNKVITGTFSESLGSLTSDDANGYAFTTSTNKAYFNTGGRGICLFSEQLLNHTSTSNLKLLHDGSAWEMSVNLALLEPLATAGGTGVSTAPVLWNCSSSAETGIQITINNTTASGFANALTVVVARNAAGVLAFNVSANNFFTEIGRLYNVRIKCTGTQMTIYKDGVEATTAARLNAQNNANSTGTVYIGRIVSSTTYAPAIMLGDFIITSRVLTDPEAANMLQYSSQMTGTFTTGTAVNYYFFWGQSNMLVDSCTNPSASLTAPMASYIFNQAQNVHTFAKTSLFVQYDHGVFPTGAHSHGPDLKFAYDMAQLNPSNTFVLKYAVGATALKLNQTSPDWNVASGTTECAHQSTLAIRCSLLQLKYVLNRVVTIRGWAQRQGETDALAVDGNVNYKTDDTNLLKKHIDMMVSLGFSTAKLRVVISLITQTYSPERPFMGDIDASIISLCDNWDTDNPTYADKVLDLDYFDTSDLALQADNTHFNNPSTEILGSRFSDRFTPYINE